MFGGVIGGSSGRVSEGGGLLELARLKCLGKDINGRIVPNALEAAKNDAREGM